MERASEGTEAVEAELEVFGRRSSSVESVGSEVQLLAPGPNGRHATFGAAAGDVPRALAPPDHFRAVGWRRRCARAPRRVKVAVAGLCVCLCAISATLLVQLRVLPAMKQQREVSDSSVVFRSFGDGSGAYACFRIPALLAVPAHDAGSHPLPFPLAARTRLLAFAEGRRSDCSDAGQIDTVLRISDDGGESWGPLHVVATAQSAGYAGHGTIGNPTPIYDARRDRVALLLTANSAADSEGEIIARTSTGGRHVFALHSDDRGRSWSRPRNVSETCKRADWTWYATGPGAAIQLRSGRLLAPANHVASPFAPANPLSSPPDGADEDAAAIEKARPSRAHDASPSAPPSAPPTYASHSLLSDDGGESWRLGGSGPEWGNEATVAQLPQSEDVLLSMRQMAGKGKRLAAISRDGGESWLPAGYDSQLIEPGCQGHLISVPPAAERGAPTSASAAASAGAAASTSSSPPLLEHGGLLFSNPSSTLFRRDLTVKFRPSAAPSAADAVLAAAAAAAANGTAGRSRAPRKAGTAGAAADPLWSGVGGWARELRVWTGPAAYSALALVGGSAVGVLFEHGLGQDGFWAQRISFRRFELAEFESLQATPMHARGVRVRDIS